MEGPVAIRAALCCRWQRVLSKWEERGPSVLLMTLTSSALLGNNVPLLGFLVKLELNCFSLLPHPKLPYLFNELILIFLCSNFSLVRQGLDLPKRTGRSLYHALCLGSVTALSPRHSLLILTGLPEGKEEHQSRPTLNSAGFSERPVSFEFSL